MLKRESKARHRKVDFSFLAFVRVGPGPFRRLGRNIFLFFPEASEKKWGWNKTLSNGFVLGVPLNPQSMISLPRANMDVYKATRLSMTNDAPPTFGLLLEHQTKKHNYTNHPLKKTSKAPQKRHNPSATQPKAWWSCCTVSFWVEQKLWSSETWDAS